MSRTPKPLTGILVTVALACLLAVSAGCAGPRPLPAESTPTATNDGRCPALGPLADVCGKVLNTGMDRAKGQPLNQAVETIDNVIRKQDSNPRNRGRVPQSTAEPARLIASAISTHRPY